MRFSVKYYGALLFMSLLLSGKVLAQEQWQLDQAAGKYWHVEKDEVRSFDLKEENPGLIRVAPEKDGKINITILAQLELDMSGDPKVRYSFNQDIQTAGSSSEQWLNFSLFGATQMVASQKFVKQFMHWAEADGFVDVEITDKNGDVALCRFVLTGFANIYNELASELNIAQIGPNASEGWQIEKGRITRVTNVDGQKIKVVVIGRDEEPEIRFYPDAEFTRNGETRVRADNDRGNLDRFEFSIWSTVLEEGRRGYLVAPTSKFDTLQDSSSIQYTIELIDRNDKHVVRTFEVADLLPAFDTMRSRYPELAIGSKNSQYYVRFNVEPAGAKVAIDEMFIFRWVEKGFISGPSSTVELSEGLYRYRSSLPDYFDFDGEFIVPEDTIINIEMKPPSGALAESIENGYVTAELIGEETWPFEADEGNLSCEEDSMAIVEIDDERYALNRAAEDLYPTVEPMLDYGEGLEDVSPFVERALSLCGSVEN